MSRYSKTVRNPETCPRFVLPHQIGGGVHVASEPIRRAYDEVYTDGPVRVIMRDGKRVTSEERTTEPGAGPTTAPGISSRGGSDARRD